MVDDLLKKTKDLIEWWKIELCIILMCLSILFLFIVNNFGSEAPYPKLLDFKKINEHKILIFTLAITLIILIGLMIASITKSFRTIKAINNVLEIISEEKTKAILKKSKILLSFVICLTLFPWVMIIPQLSIPLALGIFICKILFWKNNKEICNLFKKKIDEEVENSTLAKI